MSVTIERPPPTAEPSPPPKSQPPIRRLSGWNRDDVYGVVGSVVGSLALTWLLYERLLPLSGPLGFLVFWYASFLLLQLAILCQGRDRQDVVDRMARIIFTSAAAVLVGALAYVIGYTLFRGWRAVVHTNFFTQTMSETGPLDPLTSGGAWHAIVGTIEQVGLALLVSVPLGIATAVYLNEVRGRFARLVRTVVDAMTALPSIVAGLFVFSTLILTLHVEKSGIAAAIAISIMMLPIVTRTAEVVLRLVPGGLREASLALGASQWQTVWRVVLPTARSGLATAVILAVARGIGETAPVLLTAGVTAEFNDNPFHGPQLSLPLYILNYVRYPQETMIERAYGAALVLLVLVLVLFIVARLIGGRQPGSGARFRRYSRAARGLSPIPDPGQGSAEPSAEPTV